MPSTLETMKVSGQPAYAMLGYGGSHFLPSRSKAFSMVVQDSSCRSEEKKVPGAGQARFGSP